MPLYIGNPPANPQPAIGAARLVPVLTTLLAALLALEPVPLPGYAALAPALTLMTVYHWTIYHPALLPPITLFAIGVGYDLLCGGPPGVTALSLLLARAAVLRTRRWFFDRTFRFVWGGFVVLTIAAGICLWALGCLVAWQLLGVIDSAIRAVLTAALFPFASFALARLQRAVMHQG
jgi:rod shape-determining protein MreD